MSALIARRRSWNWPSQMKTHATRKILVALMGVVIVGSRIIVRAAILGINRWTERVVMCGVTRPILGGVNRVQWRWFRDLIPNLPRREQNWKRNRYRRSRTKRWIIGISSRPIRRKFRGYQAIRIWSILHRDTRGVILVNWETIT
jgi:hypothetical protein